MSQKPKAGAPARAGLGQQSRANGSCPQRLIRTPRGGGTQSHTDPVVAETMKAEPRVEAWRPGTVAVPPAAQPGRSGGVRLRHPIR